MKKTLFAWFSTFALILFSQLALAETAPSTPYYSTQHPLASAAAANSNAATDILIMNAISESIPAEVSTIRLVVPNSPIEDILRARDIDHVKNQTWSGDTRIQLYSRAYGPYPFFDRYVSNHATLTIYYKYGRYEVEVR